MGPLKKLGDDKNLFRLAIFLLVGGILVLLLLIFFTDSPNGVSVSDEANTLIYRPSVPTDIMNEDGSEYSFPFESEGNWSLNWFGTGANLQKSYLGMRFTGVALPAGAKLISAQLELQPNNTQIVGISVSISAELNATPDTFSINSRPSGRLITKTQSAYTNNEQWAVGTYYQIDVLEPLQEVLQANPGVTSYVLIIKSTAEEPYGRKFIFNNVQDQNHAPKLTLKYSL